MRRLQALKIKLSKKWLASPYIIWMIGFIILPLITIFIYGFTGRDDGGFTLENIINAAKDEVNLKALGLSLLISLVSTVICFVLAYPLAMCLRNLKMKRKTFIVFLFILPMWLNFTLQMTAINAILEQEGILNLILTKIGMDPLNIANTKYAIIIGMVLDYFPFMLLPIYNVISRINPRVIEASRDLGANSIKTFFKVIFPLSMPGVISGITMVFVPAISDFAIAEILGGGRLLLVGNIIAQDFLLAKYNAGSGLALILMAFVLITMAFTSGKADKEGGSML